MTQQAVLVYNFAAETVDLWITADNQIVELYFDGERVPVAAGEWREVRKVAMSTRTRTVAVKCLDRGVSNLVAFAIVFSLL